MITIIPKVATVFYEVVASSDPYPITNLGLENANLKSGAHTSSTPTKPCYFKLPSTETTKLAIVFLHSIKLLENLQIQEGLNHLYISLNTGM